MTDRMKATLMFCETNPREAAEFIENLRTTIDSQSETLGRWLSSNFDLIQEKYAMQVELENAEKVIENLRKEKYDLWNAEHEAWYAAEKEAVSARAELERVKADLVKMNASDIGMWQRSLHEHMAAIHDAREERDEAIEQRNAALAVNKILAGRCDKFDWQVKEARRWAVALKKRSEYWHKQCLDARKAAALLSPPVFDGCTATVTINGNYTTKWCPKCGGELSLASGDACYRCKRCDYVTY